MRFKWNLFGNDDNGPALALIPYAKWPTAPIAPQGIGNGYIEGSLIAPLAIPLPAGFTMILMGEMDIVKNAFNGYYRVNIPALINISRPIFENVTAYAEIYANWSTDPRAPNNLHRGFRHRLAAQAELPSRRRHQIRSQLCRAAAIPLSDLYGHCAALLTGKAISRLSRNTKPAHAVPHRIVGSPRPRAFAKKHASYEGSLSTTDLDTRRRPHWSGTTNTKPTRLQIPIASQSASMPWRRYAKPVAKGGTHREMSGSADDSCVRCYIVGPSVGRIWASN
jgi:hypothetical protein